MTAKQAKKLTIEVWTYLRDHPEIMRKLDLPSKLYDKIRKLDAECPLCDYFGDMDRRYRGYCAPSCPLEPKCGDFFGWAYARSKKTRAKYAGIIVDKVKAWRAKECQ